MSKYFKQNVQQQLIISPLQMTTNKQIVVSLDRLTLPSNFNLKKIILAIQSPPSEYFIQNEKIVKSQKINFYRQNLFIQQSNQGISFKIYQTNQNNEKRLIVTLFVSKDDFTPIGQKPTAFKIQQQGFQLTWSSWIFAQNSSETQEQSDRDYSQLDIPFGYENSQTGFVMGNIVAPCQDELKIKSKFSQADQFTPAGSPVNNKNERQIKEQGKNGSPLKNKNIQRKPVHIKSQIYSTIVSGISGFLSYKTSP